MKKAKILTTLLGLSITLSISLSCVSSQVKNINSSQLKDVTGSLPKVYQNVGPISAGNPDAVIQIDTAMPIGPSNITVFETKTIDENYALKWAKHFNLDRSPVPLTGGAREVYSYQDDNATLEVNLNGRFHWYQNITNHDPEALPSETECVPIAEKWLKDNGLYTEGTVKVRTGIHESVGVMEDGKPTVWKPVTVFVEFTTGLNGCEFYSGGAMVIIGDGSQVYEVTYNVPFMSKYGVANLKTPEAAFEMLNKYLKDPTYDPPEAKECLVNWRGFQSLKINRISLQYTMIDGSNYLQPIYVFEGDVYESSNTNPENFVGRVDAVQR